RRPPPDRENRRSRRAAGWWITAIPQACALAWDPTKKSETARRCGANSTGRGYDLLIWGARLPGRAAIRRVCADSTDSEGRRRTQQVALVSARGCGDSGPRRISAELRAGDEVERRAGVAADDLGHHRDAFRRGV